MKTIAEKWKFLAVVLLVLALGLTVGCGLAAKAVDSDPSDQIQTVPVVLGQQDGCAMTVDLGGLVGEGATVDINHGPQDLGHGDSFGVTGGSNFNWRLTVSGFTSGWKTGTGVCGGNLEVEDDDWCRMGVDLGGLAGATVDINHGPQDLKHGDSVILPTSINISWRLTVSGFTSGWKTKHVDCTDLAVLPADWCEMEIHLGSLVGTDATVDINHGPQDLKHGDRVILPTCINISWRLTVSGFTSGWKTKHVDCTDLTVGDGDWCNVGVNLNGLVGTGATVDINHGPQDMGHGDSVILPQGINISWRLTVSGFTSGWKSMKVDCGPLLVGDSDWCRMGIDLGGLAGTDATVDISHGPQDLKQGDRVILPTCINISWRLTVSGFSSGWKTKHVDCTPLKVGDDDWCAMHIDMRDDLQRAGARVDINHGPQDVTHCNTVTLPTSININWRLEVGGMTCGWYTKHVDCTPLAPDPTATVEIPQDLADAGAKVNIRYDSPNVDYGNGDQFDYVPGSNIQWQLKVSGFTSAYKTTAIGCDGVLEVTDADYCLMTIDMPDDLAAAGAKVNIRYDSPAVTSSGLQSTCLLL
jgi:hypothetical protein